MDIIVIKWIVLEWKVLATGLAFNTIGCKGESFLLNSENWDEGLTSEAGALYFLSPQGEINDPVWHMGEGFGHQDQTIFLLQTCVLKLFILIFSTQTFLLR